MGDKFNLKSLGTKAVKSTASAHLVVRSSDRENGDLRPPVFASKRAGRACVTTVKLFLCCHLRINHNRALLVMPAPI